jgi:hypothetical protein
VAKAQDILSIDITQATRTVGFKGPKFKGKKKINGKLLLSGG